LANEILDRKNPGQHNQAVMELGAIICLPRNPMCDLCPLSMKCISFNSGTINLYPQKLRNLIIKERYFNYLLIQKGTFLYLKQRPPGDIWTLLFEFPLIETIQNTDPGSLFKHKLWDHYFKDNSFKITSISRIYKHKLTHQHIYARFIEIEVDDDFKISGVIEVNRKDIENYAFPRVIDKYLELKLNNKID
jgi:A/G-specific adenine glycosylase